MSRNKLSWIFAMVLTALAITPNAYAQVLGMAGANWYYLLINALIIGVVLFILQAILVPGKDPKEKTSIWLIIIIVSLLLAWFYGRNGFLWQGPLAVIFNIKVLVNAVIIAAVLYFVLAHA